MPVFFTSQFLSFGFWLKSQASPIVMRKFIFFNNFLVGGGLAVIYFSVWGCASVSVVSSERVRNISKTERPLKILVRPYSFDGADVRVNREGRELEIFKHETQERLTRQLVRRLNRHVLPAEAIAATAPLARRNVWLLEGRFGRVYQGSRLARSLIGFGLGGTKMEATTHLSSLKTGRPEPLLIVQTSGGSNAAPGAIGSLGYFVGGVTSLAALGNLIEGLRTGVTFDTIRTAKEISAAISEYLYEQGAIPYEAALAPKRKGMWQPDFWPFSRKPKKIAF